MLDQTFLINTTDNLIKELKSISLNAEELKVVKDFVIFLETENNLISWYYIKRQSLPKQVRDISLRYAILKQAEKIPSITEIKEFNSQLFESFKVDCNENDDQKRISYNDFLKILNFAPLKIQNFLKPATLFGESLTYLDEQGRLPIDVIIQFLALKSDLMNFRLKLAYYDKNCIGNLNRQQISDFLNNEVFNTIESLIEMKEGFQKYYQKTIISMFFFFLDYKNFGRIRISDVIVSGFLENIFHQNSDENTGSHYENWFSPEKTQELLSIFHMLDENNKGFLSKEDFSKISDGSYTTAFVDRLFEIYVAKKGTQMSYDEFIIFQIAQEHLAHPASIKYFFKIIDLNNDGYLTLSELLFFYKDLKSAYCNYLANADVMPEFHDFSDSMFDMINPIDSNRISPEDLIRCKQGHEFILNLINYLEFYRFENKENVDGNDENDNFLDSIIPENNENCENNESDSFLNENVLESITEEIESQNNIFKTNDLLNKKVNKNKAKNFNPYFKSVKPLNNNDNYDTTTTANVTNDVPVDDIVKKKIDLCEKKNIQKKILPATNMQLIESKPVQSSINDKNKFVGVESFLNNINNEDIEDIRKLDSQLNNLNKYMNKVEERIKTHNEKIMESLKQKKEEREKRRRSFHERLTAVRKEDDDFQRQLSNILNLIDISRKQQSVMDYSLLNKH